MVYLEDEFVTIKSIIYAITTCFLEEEVLRSTTETALILCGQILEVTQVWARSSGFFSRALYLPWTSHDRRSSVGVADENF